MSAPSATPRIVVLDASVGVKWLRREKGSDEAVRLLEEHGDGTLRIVVPTIFVHEVIDVARRLHGVGKARVLWEHLERDELTVVGLDPELLSGMFAVCEMCGCTLYDAAAPALAKLVGAELFSADRRAHGRIEGVRLVGA